MMKTFFAIALLGVSAMAAQAATKPDAFYDKPVKTVRLPLPRDPQNPTDKTELTCVYYPHFMVKQIDLGEEGASQLSIVPGAAPACQRANIASEITIKSEDWSGYLGGAKGNYVFFTAEDGWNGGQGFALFTSDGKKLFDDTTKSWSAIDLAPTGATLRYVRVYQAKCSLASADAACWDTIKADTGITDAKAPDCMALYRAEQKRTPKEAKEVLTDPTVIDYAVTTTITGRDHKTVASGNALRCRPGD
jgi:hypothetical protein